MDFFDDEFYDGRNQSGSEIEQDDTPDIAEFRNNDGRLRFRADFDLPDKYVGEKVSLSEFKRLRDKEISGGGLGPWFGEDSHEYSINEVSGFDNNNEDYPGTINSIQLSDSISKKVDRYKEMEASFSIVDNTKINDKMQSDRERGESVKNQRKIWSGLLAVRIFTQNVLKLSNRLPPTAVIPFLDEHSRKDLDDIRKNILDLTLISHELQTHLSRSNQRLASRVYSGSPRSESFERFSSRPPKRARAELEFWDKYNLLFDNTFEWCIDVCDEWKKNTQIEVSSAAVSVY